MNSRREKKQELVAKLKEKLAGSNAVFFADYRGLTVSQISELRKKLKEVEAQISVCKNTLIQKALKETSYLTHTTSHFNLEGPTAVIFAQGDQVTPTKVIVQFAKTYGLPNLKSGFLGKIFLNEKEIQRLVLLPSRDILLTQTVEQISSPLFNLVYTLQANLQSLVYILKNKAEANH